MERTYTESELRQRLVDKGDQIARDMVGRLRDDNFFKIHSLTSSGTLQLDGEVISDWEPFRRIFSEAMGKFMAEFRSELMVALFERDTA